MIRKVWPVAAVLVVLAAAIAVLFFFDPARSGFYPKCMFHTLTGLQCPGCGSLRALHALLHSQLRRAVALNPLLFVGAFFGAYLLLRKRLKPTEPDPMARRLVWWGAPVVIVLFWIVRNLPAFAEAVQRWQ
ncbi:MAG: DUF2752 domain-containing protein [Verrucomicrobiota bacterium]|nr:DUF2752 domain-containing protein [Verrucomicrobiota bacterium]